MNNVNNAMQNWNGFSKTFMVIYFHTVMISIMISEVLHDEREKAVQKQRILSNIGIEGMHNVTLIVKNGVAGFEKVWKAWKMLKDGVSGSCSK